MSFFHRMTNAHRRRYQMVRVKINGTWIIDDSEIKEEARNLEVEGLEKPFTKEEVFGALSDFSRDKAPEFECNLFSVDPEERGGGAGKALYKWLAKVLANSYRLDFEKQWRGDSCKLDTEKAYDHVEWSFLLSVMEKMGLGRKGKVDQVEEQMTFLCWLLMWFETISRLRVNMDKSELILVGRVKNVEDLALELGCKVGSLPSTCLRMSLGALFKSMAAWDGIEESFNKRLAMWKWQYIFKGGRITLEDKVRWLESKDGNFLLGKPSWDGRGLLWVKSTGQFGKQAFMLVLVSLEGKEYNCL
ncbi:hypothetical protein CK203_048366 [Vitis vinifera]|uniref:Reverse transcriptase domain-containing protein n=1 Tax=Vitis vinifera TaxID=29760 RepID=A0A438HRG8_VITVI|nr:hypothetical protein CK203_048366 [Vitis vinifera]